MLKLPIKIMVLPLAADHHIGRIPEEWASDVLPKDEKRK